MQHTIVQVEAPKPKGCIWPALHIKDVFLAHPQLTQDKLSNDYEQAVIQAFETVEGQAAVKVSVNQGYQLLLPIGENWKAPMTVRLNSKNQVVALLHYGPA